MYKIQRTIGVFAIAFALGFCTARTLQIQDEARALGTRAVSSPDALNSWQSGSTAKSTRTARAGHARKRQAAHPPHPAENRDTTPERLLAFAGKLVKFLRNP